MAGATLPTALTSPLRRKRSAMTFRSYGIAPASGTDRARARIIALFASGLNPAASRQLRLSQYCIRFGGEKIRACLHLAGG